jgi:hypothetical protein
VLSTAVIFAGLTAAGLVFTFKKLPQKVQDFMLRHHVLTEIITTLSTMLLMGTSMTGLLGAAMVGTVTTGLLHVREHPTKYAWLHAVGARISEAADKATTTLNEWGRKDLAERNARVLDAELVQQAA